MNIALSAVIIFLLLLPPIAQDSTGQPHPTQAVISNLQITIKAP